jgi:NTP pyrophosphatase (non-canonical NTP hydrolase)
MNSSQRLVKAYLDERDWNNLAPADIAKSIMIEGVELLELFQWKNHTVEEINADPALKLNMQKEIADVVIYAIELAVHLDIDMSEVVRLKLEHNAKKYPAAKIKDSASGDDFYMDQKMKYRKEGQ